MSNTNAESFDCARRAAASRAAAVLRLLLPQRCELCVARTGGALLCDACAESLPRVAAACPVCALPSTRAAHAARVLRSRRPTPAPLPHSPMRFRSIDCSSASSTAAASRSPSGPAPRSPPPCAPRSRAGWVAAGRIASSPFRSRRRASASAASTRRAKSRRASPAAPGCRSRRRSRGSPPGRRRRRCHGRSATGMCAAPSPCAPPVRGARIALVDDVMTTGATLAEAVAHAAGRRRRTGRMLGRRAHAAALTTATGPP